MIPVLVGAFVVLVLGAAGVVGVYFTRGVLRRLVDRVGSERGPGSSWERAAASLGLKVERRPGSLGLDQVRLHGVVDGLPVEVLAGPGGAAAGLGVTTEVRVGGIPDWLRLARRELTSRTGEAAGRVRTGHGAFDARFLVSGDEAAALAVLGPTERDALLGLRGSEVSAGRGQLAVRRPGLLPSAMDLFDQVRDAVDVAKVLRGDGAPIVERLCRHLAAERDAETRRRVLSALVQTAHGQAVRVACEGALCDPDPLVRVLAAGWLGDGETLAAVLGDADVHPEIRIRALQQLRHGQSAAVAVEGLRTALAADNPWLVAAAARAVGELGLVALVPELAAATARALASGTSGDEAVLAIARAAAGAVRALHTEDAEPLALSLLGVGDERVRLPVVQALRELGSLAAVEPLDRVAREGSVGVRHAARDAIAAVQQRAGPAEAGALSLSDVGGTEGALSLAKEPPAAEEPKRREPASTPERR